MRVKIQTQQIETLEKGLDRRHIRQEVHVIYTQLVAFENQSKKNTMFKK
jgi:hypothetical protein